MAALSLAVGQRALLDVASELGQERLIEVREVERRRIARDLHDEALQDLTRALALAGRASTVIDAPDRRDELTAALERVGEQLRGAIYDLRLEGERDTPLPELLGALVAVHRGMAADCEIELDVRSGGYAGPLGAAGIEMLRILGEAPTNARRHARAARVRVRVRLRSRSRAARRHRTRGEGHARARGADRPAPGHSERPGSRTDS